jgi:hypothetical protein
MTGCSRTHKIVVDIADLVKVANVKKCSGVGCHRYTHVIPQKLRVV